MKKNITVAIRGFKDIYSETEIKYFQKFENIILNITKQYGISEIKTPIIEKTELFERSIGNETEIVNKEMYSFEDKNGESISLRPEGTATCVRCALEKNLIFDRGIKRQKFWYSGPMFRRERPQKGRFRQFQQFGLEYFGFDDTNSDLEIIMLGNRLFEKELQLKNIKLHINSIGNENERANYGDQIKSLLEKHKGILSEDQQNTLTKNPIRILDTKDKKLQEILKKLPTLVSLLSNKSKQRFENLLKKLDESNINYIVDNSIVRGLDYYNDTVFEWKHESLGSQDAICAGGRYDNLVEKIGEVNVPAIGFAAGIERIISLLIESRSAFDANSTVVAINHSKNSNHTCLMQLEKLRDKFKNISFYTTDSSSTLDKQFKQAEKFNPKYILFYDDKEINAGQYILKDFEKNQKQEILSEDELFKKLDIINK